MRHRASILSLSSTVGAGTFVRLPFEYFDMLIALRNAARMRRAFVYAGAI